jgi:hypothetical protein
MQQTLAFTRLGVVRSEVLGAPPSSLTLLFSDAFDGRETTSASSSTSSTATRAFFLAGGAALFFGFVPLRFRRFRASESIWPPRDGTVFAGRMAASWILESGLYQPY